MEGEFSCIGIRNLNDKDKLQQLIELSALAISFDEAQS
jgi:hypothetical protein